MAALWRAFPTYYVTVRKCGMISFNHKFYRKMGRGGQESREVFRKKLRKCFAEYVHGKVASGGPQRRRQSRIWNGWNFQKITDRLINTRMDDLTVK
jgi:hypothetical protein